MSLIRIISCLDVLNNQVVKGTSFSNLRILGDPAEYAAFYARVGIDELVLLDIGAGPAGKPHALDVLKSVRRSCDIPLTVGGGIRTLADAERLFDAGADKVVVNSAAIDRPLLISDLAEKFGSQAVVVSIDAYRSEMSRYLVRVHGGSTPLSIEAGSWAKDSVSRGAGEILLTSWDADGRREGFDLSLIRLISALVEVPVIASGGASSAQDFIDAFDAGAAAALAAGVFHERVIEIPNLKETLASAGILVRPAENMRGF